MLTEISFGEWLKRRRVERDLAVIRSQLDDPTFENAYNTGHAMLMEQAVAYGLEKSDV